MITAAASSIRVGHETPGPRSKARPRQHHVSAKVVTPAGGPPSLVSPWTLARSARKLRERHYGTEGQRHPGLTQRPKTEAAARSRPIRGLLKPSISSGLETYRTCRPLRHVMRLRTSRLNSILKRLAHGHLGHRHPRTIDVLPSGKQRKSARWLDKIEQN
jgi:hypothetical protein